MYSKSSGPGRSRTCSALAALCAAICTTSIVGCMGNESRSVSSACSGNNFEEVTLQPACYTSCAQEPCKVNFRMPPGDGNFLVRGRGVTIGEYPAGQTVFLGSFWCGTHEFIVEGANVPPAYLGVGCTSSGIGSR